MYKQQKRMEYGSKKKTFAARVPTSKIMHLSKWIVDFYTENELLYKGIIISSINRRKKKVYGRNGQINVELK